MTSIYGKLAISNIKNNKKVLFPYIIATSIITALFYILISIVNNPDLDGMRGADALKQVLGYGQIIVAIFVTIFLFTTYSSLIKNRSKEIGLYSVLGIDKNKIIRILSLETILVYLASTGLGLILGIIFDKLAYLLLMKMVAGEVKLGFHISVEAIKGSIIIFGLIYLLILLSLIIRVKRLSIIRLLKDSQTGEKEPKGNIIFAILALVAIGYGYYQALSIVSPLKALTEFFYAVLAVMLGTYLLFTALSVFVLKTLKKNTAYYYKTKNFISVSNLLFRIKRNAVSLANICILSAMILVTMGSTTSLYFGANDIVRNTALRHLTLTINGMKNEEAIGKIKEEVKNIATEKGVKIQNELNSVYLPITAEKIGDGVHFVDPSGGNFDKIATIVVTDLENYKYTTGSNQTLENGEILFKDPRNDYLPKNYNIDTLDYNVKERIDKDIVLPGQVALITDTYYIVVKDKNEIDKIIKEFSSKEFNNKISLDSLYQTVYGFDIDDRSKEEAIAKEIEDYAQKIHTRQIDLGPAFTYLNSESEQNVRSEVDNMFASFLFLGIVISSIFLVSQILIMYYKQLSEGYDDRDKFQIMKKVGLEDKEIKSSIRSQVLLIFFTPLLLAGLHVLVAYPLIEKILKLFSLGNTSIFIYSMGITLVVFVIFYFIIYKLTSRLYYNIVRER
ncbi:MAG: ABC transporter permease [Gemella sp.]|nr:ABC transporter permease [Gemella sp.]